MTWRSVLGGLAVAPLVGLILTLGASSAQGAEAVLGPVVIPEGPVIVCVAERCETTPPVTGVALTLTATPAAGGVEPTVTPVPCAGGTGVAARVVGTAGETAVSGQLTLTAAGGSSIALPLRRTLPGGAAPIVVSACSLG